MQRIKSQILKYRSHTHTCVPADERQAGLDPLKGPTACCCRASCYAFPRSVQSENCVKWLHSVSVMWTQAEWDTVLTEWVRVTGNATTWRAEMKNACVVWLPVQNPHLVEAGIKTKGRVGFIMPKMSNHASVYRFMVC